MGKEKVYAYIMAGGVGSRFQPISTPKLPKQFLKIIGNKSLIQQTYERISKLTDNIIIGTNAQYLNLIHKHLPNVALENILLESEAKNTAPSILLACRFLHDKNPYNIMACLPSDHYIGNNDRFIEVLNYAVDLVADKKIIMTLSMIPTYPSIDFGYIHTNNMFSSHMLKDGTIVMAEVVDSFREKPSLEKAELYLKQKYCWNAGIFVFKVNIMLRMFKKYQPKMYDLVYKVDFSKKSTIDEFFDRVKKISIDYAIMEKTLEVATIKSDVGWSDIGSWEVLEKFIQNNKSVKISGEFLTYLRENRYQEEPI